MTESYLLPSSPNRPAAASLSIAEDIVRLERFLRLLHAGRLSESALLLPVRGYNRLHALSDGLLLQNALRALGEALDLAPPLADEQDARTDLQPLGAAQEALSQSAEQLAKLCHDGGFPDVPAAKAAMMGLLRHLVGPLNGVLRETGGAKARIRKIRPAVGAARRLAAWVMTSPTDPALAEILGRDCWYLLAEPIRDTGAHHAGRPVGDVLPSLLLSFAAGQEARLAAMETPRVGRPHTTWGLTTAALDACSIWSSLRGESPSMSNKRHGFVGVMESILRLAFEANGAAGRKFLGTTTLARALQDAVRDHRCGLAG